MKKILALIMALALVMGLAVTASAADDYSITITPPAGVESVSYDIYKVFDAVPGANGTISYTLVSGKTTAPAGFTVDAAGNVSYTGDATGDELTAADIDAIRDYVTGADLVTTVEVTDGEPVVVSLDDAGYYYVTTSSGAVVAIDSTKPTAEVTDKNQVPTLEKKILVDGQPVDAATAGISAPITFQIKVTIPANATGTLTVHDKMDTGLTFGEIVSKPDGFDTFNNPGDGCTRHWIAYNASALAGRTVTFTYTGYLAANAPTDTPITNEAWLDYGEYSYTHDEVTVSTYKIDVYKWTGTESNGLAGAGFKLKNADGLYYTNTYGIVSWTAEGTEYTTEDAKNCIVNFVGLANGTYTLEESTVPGGYNKAEDEVIVIADASWTGDTMVKVENVSGSELPSTGGIGTTLFYVIGTLMMTGAAVLMITKKRMSV